MRRRQSFSQAGWLGVAFLLTAPLFCCCGAVTTLFVVGNHDRRAEPQRHLVDQSVVTPDRAPTVEFPESRPSASDQPVDRDSRAVERVELVTSDPAGEPIAIKPDGEPATGKLLPLPIVFTAREWNDDSGKFSTSATFVSLVEGTVTLDKADGNRTTLPLAKLSTADQQYVTVASEPAVDPSAFVIIGKVVGVTDGDTLTVLDGKTQTKIRLEGIDAPESGQDFGSRAKAILSTLAFDKFSRVEWKTKDKYGRTLGHIYAAGKHVNLELVERGLAWHYKEYNSDPVFADAEGRARLEKRGIWSIANPTAPWDFRHGQTNAPVTAGVVPSRLKGSPLSEPTQDTVIVYVTKTGTKYHRDGCQHLRRSKIPISLDDARRGYGPCANCDPPR